jgi:hypothetical protein
MLTEMIWWSPSFIITSHTPARCPSRVACFLPEKGLNRQTVLSAPPEIMHRCSALQSHEYTPLVCPSSLTNGVLYNLHAWLQLIGC